MNNKVLVTGGAGFIGSHLIDALTKKGYEIRCLVEKGSKEGSPNIEHIRSKGAEIVYEDITNKQSIKGICKGIDMVYHLAAMTQPFYVPSDEYEKYKEKFFEVNVTGTKNILDECIKHKVEKVVYFSSITAVGGAQHNVIIDEDTPYRPDTPYEESKCESEKLALEYWNKHRLPITIIRPLMVYGERNMMPDMIKMCKLVKSHIFPLIGYGKALANFTHVANIVHGAILAGENDISNGKIYIIGDERSYSLKEVVDAIAEVEEVKFIPYIPIPTWVAYIGALFYEWIYKIKGDIPTISRNRVKGLTSNRVYSISRAKRDLGYKPIVDLKTGVRRMVEWYKNNGYF